MFGWKVLDVLAYLNLEVFMKKLYIISSICNHNWKCLIHKVVLIFFIGFGVHSLSFTILKNIYNNLLPTV